MHPESQTLLEELIGYGGFFVCVFSKLCYNTVMNGVRVKAYAKINLTLYVCGRKNGYHMLDSLVSSVDLYDLITLKKRADSAVTITGCEGIPPEENNAVKAAKLFIKEFATSGVDITVEKNIPFGAGLGGSSADAAGVLNGLAKLYKIRDREKLGCIADMTGSDTRYMLTGGFARLFGRGERVKPVDGKLKLYLLLLVPDEKVSTPLCFKAFDALGKFGGNSDEAEKAAAAGDIIGLAHSLSNSLTDAAVSLSDGVRECIGQLKNLNALAVNMTGSGSGVYAIFESYKLCKTAKRQYSGNAESFILSTR